MVKWKNPTKKRFNLRTEQTYIQSGIGGNGLLRKKIRLPSKKWGHPFGELERKLAKASEDGKKYQKSVAVGDCSRYYRYLEATWSRLEVDYEVYDKYLSILEKQMKPSGEIQQEPLGPSFFDMHLESMTYLSLDVEVLFILGKILMEKLAYTVQLFFSMHGLPGSFRPQRKFFLAPKNIPFNTDEEYAKYVRKETDWFERSLRLPRNKLIVHGLTYVSAIKSSSDGTLTHPRMGWGRETQKISVKLKELKAKLEARHPELRKVSGNIFEFTRLLLNRPDIVLEPDDADTLATSVRRAGSELPDISSLADNIIRFTEFFCDHFARKPN